MDVDVFQEALKAQLEEARGDASNLKGTDYHLLYAMWQLLQKRANGVSFYAGNDLTIAQSSPSSPKTEDSRDTTAKIGSPTTNKDVWVQLKCTSKPWTRELLLTGNLVPNFFCNSLISESNGNEWKIELVTTAEVRSKDIEEFVVSPNSFEKLSNQLDSVVDGLLSKLSLDESKKGFVRDRILGILSQIAGCRTVHRDVLHAQIMERLADRIPDREQRQRHARSIYGAMLSDAISDGATPITYDLIWLSDKTGIDFSPTSIDEVPLVELCQRQVESRRPDGFGEQSFTPRARLKETLKRFLTSESTIFVLDGSSGTGKTWALYDWCINNQQGLRLFIPIATTGSGESLESLVSRELVFCDTSDNGRQRFSRLASASSRDTPLVVVLDDLRPLKPREYSRMLARVVREAKDKKLKVVLSCQSDFVVTTEPLRDLEKSDIFRLQSEQQSLRPSLGLTDFDDNEIRNYVSGRVAEPEEAVQYVCDPSQILLRNPRDLSAFVESLASGQVKLEHYVGLELLDQKLKLLLENATNAIDYGKTEVAATFNDVVATLWEKHGHSLTKLELLNIVGSQTGQVGPPCLEALYRGGVFTDEKPEKFSNRSLWARCIAKYITDQGTAPSDIARRLDHQSDQDLVAQVVAVASDPVSVAVQIVEAQPALLSGVAIGLMYSEADDIRVYSLLHMLARKELGNEEIADAIGKFAVKSRRGNKWLRRLYTSYNNEDRHIAEHALWSINKVVPRLVAEIVATRIRIGSCWYRKTGTSP